MEFLESHIPGWWTNGTGENAERVPIMVVAGLDSNRVLCCRGDNGELTVIPIDKIRLDWRYSVEKGRWIDISMPDEEEEEEGVGDTPDGDS